MADFDVLFSEAMGALVNRGLDFRRHAQQMLSEVLGPSAAEPLFIIIGDAALTDPRLFIKSASMFLGQGFRSVCRLLAARAIEDVQGSRLVPAVAALDDYMATTKLVVKAEQERKKPILLHDHRIPDDIEEYQDQMSE